MCRALHAENQAYLRDVLTLGPVAAPLGRLQKQYRWQLLLKGLKPNPLHSLTRDLVNRVEGTTRKGKVKLIVDVDPVDML